MTRPPGSDRGATGLDVRHSVPDLPAIYAAAYDLNGLDSATAQSGQHFPASRTAASGLAFGRSRGASGLPCPGRLGLPYRAGGPFGAARWLPPAEEVTVRQKLGSVAVLGVVTLLAAACGSSSPSATPSSSAPAATAAFKACVISDTGTIIDKSFNQSAYEGATQAAAASGGKITAQFLPSSSPSDYASNITSFINQKCGIIVTVGFLMGDATATAAKANPSQKFAIVDFTYPKPFKNVSTLVFNTVEDGFQAGYLAAGMSKTGTVATFGGQKLPTVTIYMDGFWDGVQYYNTKHHKNVKVLGWNEKTQNGSFVGGTNPFGDQAAGARITNTFISDNADIIFPVAGGDGVGTAAAIKTADAGGKNVNMFWVDTDGCVSSPN